MVKSIDKSRDREYYRLHIISERGPEGIIIIRMVDRCNNEIENDKLEQQMGLNRQPVGVEEISKLAELLESAEPRKPY